MKVRILTRYLGKPPQSVLNKHNSLVAMYFNVEVQGLSKKGYLYFEEYPLVQYSIGIGCMM